jgi:hypothetical protein
MSNHKTLLTRWPLPLLFFFLSIFVSSANANDVANKTWSEPTVVASMTLDTRGLFSPNELADRGKYGQPKVITNKNNKAFAVWTQYHSALEFSSPYRGLECQHFLIPRLFSI